MFCQNNKDLQKNIDAKQGGLCFSMLMASYVIFAFIVQSILLSFTKKESFIYLAVCSLLSIISIFGVIIYTRLHKKIKFDLGLKNFKPNHLIFVLLLSAGMFLGLGFVNLKINEALVGLGVNTSSPEIVINNVRQFLFFTLTLAIMPAIFEEIFFRGILLNALSKKHTLLSVITVSLCFSLYHCNLSQFVYQFIYGVAFSFVAISLKSVIPCIISHFLNNFIVLLSYFVGFSIDLYSILIIGMGLICLIGLSILIVNLFRKNKLYKKDKSSIGEFIISSLFGVIICVLMIVSALMV